MAGGRTGITKDGTRVGAVNVLVTLTGHEESGAGAEDNVFGQQRPPLKAEAAIESEIVAGVIGEEHLLGHRGVDRPDVVHIHESSQLRGDVGVETVTDNDRAGINEIGLAFRFTRAEIDYQTVSLLK